jgi:hypothetical protein
MIAYQNVSASEAGGNLAAQPELAAARAALLGQVQRRGTAAPRSVRPIPPRSTTRSA